MNIFFVFDDGSIATPPLTGTILPGITRDSIITLARDMGLTVREEPYAIEQWRADAESGRLTEAFACGTAAVVTPIGQSEARRWRLHDRRPGGPGQVTRSASRQRSSTSSAASAPDPHGWVDAALSRLANAYQARYRAALAPACWGVAKW